MKRTDNNLTVILIPQKNEIALLAKNHNSLETEKLLKNHPPPLAGARLQAMIICQWMVPLIATVTKNKTLRC